MSRICSICNKQYKDRTGLWRHAKKGKCSLNSVEDDEVDTYPEKEDIKVQREIDTPYIEAKPIEQFTIIDSNLHYKKEELDMIKELLKQNNELQKKIIEMSCEPKIINNTTNNYNSTQNTLNNQFNLNMFLNEECKNALDLKDFITSIELTLEDLEETGRLGFIDGLTRIIVNNLKRLDVRERPIHCTDLKRETVYIKDQNQWNKDNAEKEHMLNAVNRVVFKNLKLIPMWQQNHPNYNSIEDLYQQYLKISMNSLGPYSDEETKKHKEKIIRNILKEALLDKKQKDVLE